MRSSQISPSAISSTYQNNGQIERNKKIVIDFYELAFNQHKPLEAANKYIGKEYLPHNHSVKDGTQAFVDVFEPFLQVNPQSHAEIKRVVAEGNLVIACT